MARAGKELAAVEGASFDELSQRYPEIWKAVGERLVNAAKGGPPALEAFVREAQALAAPWRERVQKSHGDPRVVAQALPPLAAARLARLATQQTLLAAATGQTTGSVRLGLWSGAIVQRLLFANVSKIANGDTGASDAGALERKPASLRAFRLFWPLVTRKRALMPLVQQRGIFCFYSRELVRALAALLEGRPTVELAAGDGTLSRFLRAQGAQIQASDDQSWKHVVAYPPEVEKADAATVLTRDRPRAVVCSFPPPGNPFEQRVFRTASVELYVVVTTRHRFAAGDWEAYQQQQGFDWGVDEALSPLVLPPEVDPAVLVFRRR